MRRSQKLKLVNKHRRDLLSERGNSLHKCFVSLGEALKNLGCFGSTRELAALYLILVVTLREALMSLSESKGET